MKANVKILILCVIAFFTACNTSQQIVYDISKYQSVSESVNVSLSIQTFEDIRQELSDNLSQLYAKDVVIVTSEKYCINAEKIYKIPVGQQLADMLGKYLNKKSYFANVLINQNEQTDYYVTAKVKRFIGYQKYSTAKTDATILFGLIGALATMNLKTEGKIVIELSDICLYNKAGILIAEIGDFKKEYEGDFPIDSSCYCIYQNINQSLADFNEELGAILFQEIKKLN